MSIRVKFYFCAGADPINSKTTISLVKSIQIENSEDVFVFPPEWQPLKLHTELIKIPIIAKVVKNLKKRGDYRQCVVTLSEDVKPIYFDEEGNPRYGEVYLEDSSPPEFMIDSNFRTQSAESMVNQKKQSLQSVTKDAVIEKFNGRTPNPNTWIQNLERECQRLEIPTERNCEVLRLFIEGIAVEWYQTIWTLSGIANWQTWRESFLDYFGSRGWTESSFAYNFRYVSGSFSSYVIKKLSLLANCDPELSDNSRIMIVVAGLPSFLYDKLERDKMKTVSDLIKKINQLDRPQTKTSKNNNSNDNNSERIRNPNFKACSYCAKIGKPGRYHPESVCKTKQFGLEPKRSFTNNNSSDKNIKISNNTELEELLNEEVIDQKN